MLVENALVVVGFCAFHGAASGVVLESRLAVTVSVVVVLGDSAAVFTLIGAVVVEKPPVALAG
jgi:hypothetical protein